MTGYAKVGGRTVAVSRKRASFGQDVLWQLGFRDLTTGKVRSAETFRKALASSPFTFNVGYADDRDIAMYSAGRLPVRPKTRRPAAPRQGHGRVRSGAASSPPSERPYQANPPTGVLVNWNNRPAPGWGAADDNWSYGSTQRVRMLDAGIAKRQVHDLASVTSAMNAAATKDPRSEALTPVLERLLKAHPTGATPRAARMLELLVAWRAAGSSRVDREPDGVIDAGPAPAIWDAFYPRLWKAAMPVDGVQAFVGDDSGTGSDFTGGGFWYLEKDLGRLTGITYRDPYKGATAAPVTPRSAPPRSGRRSTRCPASPTRCGATPTRSGSRSGPGCCRPRSATRTGRADPAGDLLRSPPAPLGRHLGAAGYGSAWVTTRRRRRWRPACRDRPGGCRPG